MLFAIEQMNELYKRRQMKTQQKTDREEIDDKQ